MLKRFMALIFLLPTLVFAEHFVAGKDYQVITAPAALMKHTKPVVTEFFSYGCPWCYKLEATIETWLKTKNDKIVFNRVPVVFHTEWELYAKAYYIAQTLKQTEKFTPLLFKVIQTDKKPLNTNASMIDFFVGEGVDKSLVTSALENSSSLDLLVKNGMVLMAQYQVKGVPAFVVNGQYKTDLEMAQNPTRLLQILDYLITLKSA